MKKTISPIIAFSIIILIAGIAGAAIFLFSQEVKDEFLIDEETEKTTETIKEDDDWIFLEKKFLAEQEGLMLSYYEFIIDEKTKIIFTGKNQSWYGDIILEQEKEKFVIKENTELYGPGGFAYFVYKTNFSNLIVLRNSFADLISGISWFTYFDLNKKEIVATKIHLFSPSHLIEIEQAGEKEIEIYFDMDSCKDKFIGDLIEIRGILFNGMPIFFHEGPFLIACKEGMTDIELYGPYVYFEEIIPNFYFSKLKFNINIKGIQNKESYTEWRKLIILDLKSNEAIFEDIIDE